MELDWKTISTKPFLPQRFICSSIIPEAICIVICTSAPTYVNIKEQWLQICSNTVAQPFSRESSRCSSVMSFRNRFLGSGSLRTVQFPPHRGRIRPFEGTRAGTEKSGSNIVIFEINGETFWWEALQISSAFSGDSTAANGKCKIEGVVT